MRKLKQSVFFAVALAFFFGAFAVADADAQLLNKVLNRMQVHKDKLQSLKADVSMRKTDSTLGISETTSGTTYYLPGKNREPYVRVNWTRPLQETLLVKKGKYVLYRPRLKQAITGKVSDSKKNTKTNSALDFMNMSKRELKANYKIKMLKNAIVNGDEVWHLELTPKSRKSYKYAEIWVDTNGMPVRMKMVEQNDDITVVSLSSVKKNLANFDANVFNLKLPKNTNIVGD